MAKGEDTNRAAAPQVASPEGPRTHEARATHTVQSRVEPGQVGDQPDQGARLGSITIARHGRPALDRSTWMGWRGYRIWWAAYDEGGLADDQGPSEALMQEARGASLLISSTLRRSRETAAAVAEGRHVQAEAVFVEAPLPPPPIPLLRLRPGAWGVVARLSWWLGASGGQESRRQAEQRADEAVARLITAAEAGESVLVCAHGWFNRMMRPVFLAHGWRCVRDGRDGYWSFRRYEKRS